MDRVDERLWIGDAADGRDWKAIVSAGITAVFNATQETDGWPDTVKAAMPYLRLNQPDGVSIPQGELDRFAAWFEDHKDDVVLIHCGAGVSRAATFSILWLILRDGLSWQHAEQLVRAARPIVNPNPILVQSVMAWLVIRR